MKQFSNNLEFEKFLLIPGIDLETLTIHSKRNSIIKEGLKKIYTELAP